MEKIKVAYQGVPGAYSEAAITKAFPEQEVEAMPFASYAQVFEAVETSACDYGVIPMENSAQGSVHKNYLLLARCDLHIVKEVFVPIHYSLIGLPDAKKEDISLVITHPAALEECQAYLKQLPRKPVIETVYDSAGAVEMLLNFSNYETALLGAKSVAELHDLAVLDENVEDNPHNMTRYNVISREAVDPGKGGKTSVVFTTHHRPGALLNAMKVFADRGIDLSKIESRPIPDQPYEYMFYADIDGPVSSPNVKAALDDLEHYHSPWMRVLGSYISRKD